MLYSCLVLLRLCVLVDAFAMMLFMLCSVVLVEWFILKPCCVEICVIYICV